MKFVPIPTTQQALEKSEPVWLPFLLRISERSGETVNELHAVIMSGQVQIGIVWDEEQQKARALLGMLTRKVGHEIVGEVHWVTGFGVKDWQHLLPELEKFLKEGHGCTIIKPICRPGWKPFLKKYGYKQTHIMMEKPL